MAKLPRTTSNSKPKSTPGSKGPKTGYDPVKLMKRFFMYRNVFGNMTGSPGTDPPGSNFGDISAFTSGRHMGLI